MRKKIFIISIITIILDQFIKYFIVLNEPNFAVIKNLLSITYTKNNGVAFSLFSGSRIPIIIVSIILVIILIISMKKEYLKKDEGKKILNVGYGILIGGIFGNLIDRIIRGVVVDYVSLKIFGYYFPVFNLADLNITIGVIIVFFLSFTKEDKLKNKTS